MGSNADYGVDAPGVLLGFRVVAFVAFTAAAVGYWRGAAWLVWPGLLVGTWFAVSAGIFVNTSRNGKHRVWAELLDQLELRGDERALDVGCGRGAVLVAVAKRLPRGKVHGIDLWSTVDQSGNAASATEANLAAEGVTAELVTGDMRRLPYAEGTLDVVVSSLAVHNIPDVEGRRAAISQMWRVLKPGGKLIVADIQYTADYAAALRLLGADPEVFGLGWRFW